MDTVEFFKLLTDHDWTYNYSDDHRAWTKGSKEAFIIKDILQEVPLYTKMYKDYADYMFKPLDERKGLEKPKLEDYLN